MRRGRVAFFDPASGEGIIVANGHEYPVRAGDVLAGPLGPRVPVEFDVVRDGAVPRAVAVRVRTGGRVNRRQGRFAETTARSADAAGSPPLSRRRPGLTRRRIGRPKSLVAEWLGVLAAGDYPTAAQFLAPDAVLVVEGREVVGRARIVDELPALAPSRLAEIAVVGAGNEVVVSWRDGRETWTIAVEPSHGYLRRLTATRSPTPEGAG